MTRPTNALVFGTMRLHELSARAATELLAHLLDRGVRRFHSSTEYDSFERFREALAEACSLSGCASGDLRHVVKIADPHFGETSFDRSRLTGRVGAYIDALGAENIDVVQWMIRHDLDDESGRLDILARQSDEIADTVSALKRDGLIRRFGCFPYTRGMREAVLRQPWCDVLLDYLNPVEQECRTSFGSLRDDQSVIGIRPFMPALDASGGASAPPGGRRTASGIAMLLEHALSDPSVEAVVAGTGRIEHADEMLDHLGRLPELGADDTR